AAAIIGEACSAKHVMTTALVLGSQAGSDEALSKTLAQLRPHAMMVVIANADEYIEDMLTALRAGRCRTPVPPHPEETARAGVSKERRPGASPFETRSSSAPQGEEKLQCKRQKHVLQTTDTTFVCPACDRETPQRFLYARNGCDIFRCEACGLGRS